MPRAGSETVVPGPASGTFVRRRSAVLGRAVDPGHGRPARRVTGGRFRAGGSAIHGSRRAVTARSDQIDGVAGVGPTDPYPPRRGPADLSYIVTLRHDIYRLVAYVEFELDFRPG